jgi:hypothetical protein
MFARTKLVVALGAVVFGMLMGASIYAGSPVNKTMYLTFNRPVALPGVALGAGTYIFEVPAPTSAWDVVQVLSRDRKIVYYAGFTREVYRPEGKSHRQAISFAEAQPDVPQPIAVWWPDGATTGRQFVYDKH